MDVRRIEMQQRLLAAAAHPDGPNVWVSEPPCTSFSDWQIHNGGTRTYSKPCGDRPRRGEVEGNAIAEFMATLAAAVLDSGKFFLCENPARSGRYPKLWDTVAWQRLLARDDVTESTWAFCAWDMRPAAECRTSST